GYRCIGGYTGAQVPNLVALANQFAISDPTFSMANNPSRGGHLYAGMASTDGFIGDKPNPAPRVKAGPRWCCDSHRLPPWISPRGVTKLVPSCTPARTLGLPNGGAFRSPPVKHAPPILDRLQAAGFSWRIYGEPKPPGSGGPTGGGYGWDICP